MKGQWKVLSNPTGGRMLYGVARLRDTAKVMHSGNLEFHNRRGKTMRTTLKKARQDAGLTQEKIAEYLNISLRHYKYMESGGIVGNVELWDKLEDLFNIHQRKLREIEATRHDQGDNQ